ncbi:MAG: hypothetical protein QXK80_01780 [Candidatus Pacearchaeota archaeon]
MKENLENIFIKRLVDHLFNEANDLYNSIYKYKLNKSIIKNRALRTLILVPEPFKGIFEEPFYFSIETILKKFYKNGNSNTDIYKKLAASYNFIRKCAGKEKFNPEI